MELRAPLPHEDVTRAHRLAPEALDAEVLRARVAAVAGRADPFLMRHGSPDLHVLDLDLGEILPVPGLAPVPGAARKPEDADLLALAVPHHLRSHLGATHERLTRMHLLAVADQQDVIEGDRLAGLRGEQRHLDGAPRLGLELLATGRENGVGHRAGTLIAARDSVKRGGGWEMRDAAQPITHPRIPHPGFTPPHTAPSRRAPPAWPSSGIRPGASSGRRAPRARGRSAFPVAAGSSAPAPAGTGRPRGGAARRVGAPCDRRWPA